jgi:predicted secreted Zn-dependent protease
VENVLAISFQEQVTYWRNDDISSVLSQHVELDVYSASLPKQQSTERNVAPVGHIFMTLSQPPCSLNVCLATKQQILIW